jgi:predicted transcriptional regulator
MNDKQMVLARVRQLPEDASVEAISEEVKILAALQRGVEAAEAGRTQAHAEVKRLFAAWNAK